MSDLNAERPSLTQLVGLVRAGVEAGDPQAKVVWIRFVFLFRILVALLVINLVGSCAVGTMSGTPHAPVGGAITSAGDKVMATGSVPLSPAMNPVRLVYTTNTLMDQEYDYSLTVTDPAGKVVASQQGTLTPAPRTSREKRSDEDRPPEPKVESPTHYGGLFRVENAGLHEFRFELKAPAGRLRSIVFEPRIHARESHFFAFTFLLGGIAWGAQRWWRSRLADPWWATQAPAEAPAEPEARASPPAFEAPPVFASPFEAGSRPSLGHRLAGRAFFWFLSLGVSALWLPVAGVYFMFVLFGIALLFQTADPAATGDAIKTAIESPLGQSVLRYLFGEGSVNLKGLAAANFLGAVAFKALLPFHIILLVVSAVRQKDEDAAPPTLQARFKALVRWNLIFYGVLVLIVLVAPMKGTSFFDAAGGLALLQGFAFAGATIVLWLVAGLEKTIANGREALE